MFTVYPIVGLIRFSFFGPTDTRQKHVDEAAKDQLYNAERLETRFRFFEKVTLPSLRAQDDPNFMVLVITSDVMPEPYLARLYSVTQDIPQIRVHVATTMNFEKEIHPTLLEACETSPNGCAAVFRLDDDDALSYHYIRRLREIASGMPEKTIITFPRSFCAFRDEDGFFGMVPRMRLCTGAGLVRVVSKSFIRSPISAAHGDVWRRFMTISEPRFVSNLVTYHDHNDTRGNREKHMEQFRKELRPRLARLPKVWTGMARDLEENFRVLDLPSLAAVLDAELKSEQKIGIGLET